MALEYRPFAQVNLSDPFFDSLKHDYAEFQDWFQRKADQQESAYVFYTDEGVLDGFLYLKTEQDAVTDVVPPLPALERIKVGTFKINAHGTKLGERFLKKVFDHAVDRGLNEIYVTIFDHHQPLIGLFAAYGFRLVASKVTQNGTEGVYLRQIRHTPYVDPIQSYPLVSTHINTPYMLALQPQWHTRLLPDSILVNENMRIVRDISHTNSIHKVYLGAIPGMDRLTPGTPVVIYRTTDNMGPAEYRSVATSICVIEEYRHLSTFSDLATFLRYCEPYSVFTREELHDFWRTQRYPHIIRFSYNVALNRRITRQQLADVVGIDRALRWSLIPLTQQQLLHIARLGQIDESLIIH